MSYVFRSIEYPSDPLANEAAQLVLTEIYNMHLPQGNSAEHYQTIAEGYHNYCLVGEDDRVVGVGSLDFHPVQMGMSVLHNIVVAREHRRSGAGKYLVTRLEQMAIAAGADVIRVTSTPLSGGFYERLGYQQIGATPQEYAKRLD
jgi:N-acetylglutamate synthase-like GNAT family acetyltransferase